MYHFARDNVETLPWSRVDTPYAVNGSGEGGWPGAKEALAQRQADTNQRDIANKEVRPDVWVAVNKNVQPTANWRSNKPPTVGNFEPYQGAPPVPEFAHPSWKEPAPAAEE